MIHPDSRKIEWIRQVSESSNYTNIVLIEKTIRAFSLLEALVLSGCPFVFKGGTALMLHLDSAKRLSIDIDIICPPNTNIEQYLNKNAQDYGFSEIKLTERKTSQNLLKNHAKYYYQATYKTHSNPEYILLDVLYEDIHYNNVVQLPIISRFLKTDGKPVFVNTPSIADLLGDKLTAFAPNTTGIPYFKGENSCSMEIIKQLYDIAALFDITNDLRIVCNTFRKFAATELKYRNLNPDNTKQVLDDIFQTSLCICMQGKIDNEYFKLLQDGIKRIQSFIHGERYFLDTAIVNASKAAYLSVLIANEIMEVKHFDKNQIQDIQNTTIPTKLNKLKKNNIEAYFYWHEIQNYSLQALQKYNHKNQPT